MERLVVIGGVAAGMSAASQARRRRPDMEVIALEKGGFVSYGSCGLPYYISRMIPEPESLVAVTPREFRDKRGIIVRLHSEVLQIDPPGKRVRVRNHQDGSDYWLGYGKLVIATGAHAVVPSIPGRELKNIFTLRTLEDGIAVRTALSEAPLKKGVILGAGYIGLEMAESFRALNMEVTTLEKLPQILGGGMEHDITAVIEEELKNKGVLLKKDVSALSFLGNSHGEVTAVETSGGRIPADLVILGVGIRPSVEIAQEAGIALGPTGAVAVNDRMETNIPGIYAAGDCTEAYHLVAHKPVWIPLGPTANKQGRVAGANAAGGHETFPGIVGTAVFKTFDLEVARTGLTLTEARDLGHDAAASTISDRTRAGYYPGGSSITISLIFDKTSGKLLGAQMVGKEGVAKRIDTLATALHAGMGLKDIASLDLSYAPPFAPVWDPILIAAQAALKHMSKIKT